MMGSLSRQMSLERTALTQNYVYLEENLDVTSSQILSHLIAAGIITIDDKERITSQTTRKDKCIQLLDMILRRKKPGTVEGFIKALQKDHEWVYDYINKAISRIKRERFRNGGRSQKVAENAEEHALHSSQTDEKWRHQPVESEDPYSSDSECESEIKSVAKSGDKSLNGRSNIGTQVTGSLRDAGKGRVTLLEEQLQKLRPTSDSCACRCAHAQVRAKSSIDLREDPLPLLTPEKKSGTLPSSIHGLSSLPSWANPNSDLREQEQEVYGHAHAPEEDCAVKSTQEQEVCRSTHAQVSDDYHHPTEYGFLNRHPLTLDSLHVTPRDTRVPVSPSSGCSSCSVPGTPPDGSEYFTSPTEGPDDPGIDEVDSCSPLPSPGTELPRLQRKNAVRNYNRSASNVETRSEVKSKVVRKSQSADDAEYLRGQKTCADEGYCAECGRYRRSMVKDEKLTKTQTFCTCKIKRNDSDALRQNRENAAMKAKEFITIAPVLFPGPDRSFKHVIPSGRAAGSAAQEGPCPSGRANVSGAQEQATTPEIVSSTGGNQSDNVSSFADEPEAVTAATSSGPLQTAAERADPAVISAGDSRRVPVKPKRESTGLRTTDAIASVIPATVATPDLSIPEMTSSRHTRTPTVASLALASLSPIAAHVTSPYDVTSDSSDSCSNGHKRLCKTQGYGLADANGSGGGSGSREEGCYEVTLTRELGGCYGLRFINGASRERFPGDDEFHITKVTPGTPASSSPRMREGDTLVSVNGRGVRGREQEDVEMMFRETLTVRLVLSKVSEEDCTT